MTVDTLGEPPVLSTPDTHILSETDPPVVPPGNLIPNEQIFKTYEIQRTLDEIRRHSWRKIALQFPDEMLPDSAQVYQLLARGLRTASQESTEKRADAYAPNSELSRQVFEYDKKSDGSNVKLTILADTSYGACCVDEIAAEHVDAEAVVHYGRACLSPTARLPVIHIFTHQGLDCEKVVDSFKDAFSDRSVRIVLTADLPYAHHVQPIYQKLLNEGYQRLFAAEIIRDPASPIPNRTVPEEVLKGPERLEQWRLFHISHPPTSLLLTLSSRLSEIRLYPTEVQTHNDSIVKSLVANTSLVLRRRYALVTSIATVAIWGVLINTLSVKNYLHVVDQVRSQIAAAGKKSYLLVVGKLNAAKIANFGEIGGWVVVGCWESSLVDSKDFYKPVITPFELELALRRDEERIWTGEWSADFQRILDHPFSCKTPRPTVEPPDKPDGLVEDHESEGESAPPEFDLRKGRYVSQTRPMQAASTTAVESFNGNGMPPSAALIRRANGEVVSVNGMMSPAAQFLQSKRTWKGLGSDFDIAYEDEEINGGSIQQGRSGIARGYVVGSEGSKT